MRPSSSAPTASSSTSGAPPTACSSSTTTPASPTGGRSSTRRRELPAHVPTFGAALDACAGAWVNIEIKNDRAEPDYDPDDRVAVEVLADLGRAGRRSLADLSFRLATVDRCRLLDPTVPTAWLTFEVDPTRSTSPRRRPPARAPVGADRSPPSRSSAATTPACLSTRWTCNDPDALRRSSPSWRRRRHRHRRPGRHAGRAGPPRLTTSSRSASQIDDRSPDSGAHGRSRAHEADGVGDVVELEAVDLAEVVAVELVRERVSCSMTTWSRSICSSR